MSLLEPDVEAALEAMRHAERPSFEELSVGQARSLYLAGRETVQLPPVSVERIDDLVLAGRPARSYRPEGAADGTVLFLHGGGFVIGNLETHDGICRRLATASGTEVVALDDRLAPEHRFPAAFDDCLAAFGALRGRIAIAGDSAGAALALAVALAGGGARPAALALFYPVADVANESASYASVDGVPISAATMRWFWCHAFTGDADRLDERASPLLSPSLARLPPTFLTTAGHDPLCDEGLALAERMAGEGVLVEHRHLPGQIHGYLTLGRLIGEAERSIAAAATFLARHLRGT